MDGFNSMIVNIGTEDVPVALFAKDIEDIAKQGYSDISELFGGKLQRNASDTAAVLKINPKELKGVEFRFNLRPDSTAKINKEAQRQSVVDAISTIGKMQNVFQDDPRLTVRWDKIMADYQALSDVPGASEWIEFDPEAKKDPQPPSATVVQLPNGKMIDATDMVKLFEATPDGDFRAQIAAAFGFKVNPAAQVEAVPEAPAPEPTVGPNGQVFNDPTIGQAAAALHGQIMPQGAPLPKPEAPQQSTVAPDGHMFADPELGKAAETIFSATSPMPAPLPKETPVV
jgi:hypothetical protein